MFESSRKIGIVCCSDGQKTTYINKMKLLENTLLGIGIEPVFSNCIYAKECIYR